MESKKPSNGKVPPPLPPRQSSSLTLSQTASEDAPPPYEAIQDVGQIPNGPWSSRDPRSSSQQSLVPSESDHQNERRKLLLIYIHGFMGNETSFRGFPAHLHHLLKVLLAETHIVHTKIYPRYRSKRSITFARDDFSRWLEPHEDPKTDVVLLGHSMGGLLAAEVVLMPPAPPASRPLKHRILGTINFDVPFLGMHPGVVRSGLAGIFVSSEKTHEDKYSPQLTPVNSNDGTISPPGRQDTVWGEPDDPTFNPSFKNDVVLPVRQGWRNAWHFVNKHSGDLTKATKQLVSSHMEFGGAMANYPELKTRYTRIRALEEENEDLRKSVVRSENAPLRVRFVNYYTASTGIPKKPKPPPDAPSSSATEGESSNGGIVKDSAEVSSSKVSQTPSPRISLEEYRDDGTVASVPVKVEEVEDATTAEEWEDAAESLAIGEPAHEEGSGDMTTQEPMPMKDDDYVQGEIDSPMETLSSASTLDLSATLPPIPDLPPAPPPLDVTYIQDAETRKLVEKEHSRAVKAYEKAMRDREKAIKDRAKLEAKREQRLKKEAEKAAKGSKKVEQKSEKDFKKQLEKARKAADVEVSQKQGEELRLEKERLRMEAEARRMRGEPEPSMEEQDNDNTLSRAETAVDETPYSGGLSQPQTTTSMTTTRSATSQAEGKDKGPLKDRKFCMLPPRDSRGQLDPCWVRVFMENVDEVGAHCGLFFVDERYERLVGDVAERIEGWVHEDSGFRVATEKHW